ncbi:hypothetical protein COCON_G00031130 [Conger conger]|uniref:VWFA domain-containing protein n=1 Tax=Conger conger TaxID=82655 RepID=A0A9Q1I789_CONCO|nr:hypothetical protein COCON_G00031130 [Conger conger]
MDWMVIIPLYLCTVFQTAYTFNVDPTAWKSFSNDATAFGYRVIQANTESLLISAPLYRKQDRKGIVYNCKVGTSTCSEISIRVPSHGINMSLGLSMSKDHKSQNTMVCGPTISRQCDSITTYNGMCFKLNTRLEEMDGFGQPKLLRDCPMEGLLGRNSKFSIMQYSNYFQTVFNFNNFNGNNWRNQVNGIRQLTGYTHTPTAIYKVVHELFIPASGSRLNAHKVLLVITDGQTYGDSTPLSSVIPDADRKGIIRYAIGVGKAFNPSSQGLTELQIIASKPTRDHLFKVDNFNALDKLRDTLQKNIFAIEGTTGESFKMELAQEGFSSAWLPSGEMVMGAVGALDWKGGYQKFQTANQSPDILGSNYISSDSYLGYSMAVAEMKNKETYIILGAPRYQHAGQVIVFFPGTTQKIESEQIGSYFGAEVCTVDLNSDSITDLLLISAPTYLDKQRDSEGKVYICTFTKNTVSCRNMALVGEQGVKGKFGTSLAAISDLNGDKLSEVAVGAPQEDNGQGTVYIFSGVKGGIKTPYSQRIQSASVQSGLHYFGQSISGSMDQTADGLIDIAVGSKGKVLLLRSRPVVSVGVTISYTPSVIPVTDCTGTTPITAKVCFSMQRGTQDKIAKLEAQVAYTFKLDSTRPRFRAYFTSTNQTQEKVFTLTLGSQCHDTKFQIAECPEDALNPLLNELAFRFVEPSKQPHSQNLSPILASPSQTAIYPLDFERNCGPDNKCIDDLKVGFNFSGASVIEVGIASGLEVTVSVENRGEDSYNSHVIFTYPPGLSFRKVTVVQDPSKRDRVQCSAVDSEDATTAGKSVCFVNKPVFKTKARVVFIILLGIDGSSQFDQTVTFTANATSGNDQHAGNENFQVKRIKVKLNIYMLIKGLEETTSYINFTAGKNDLKRPVLHSFEIVNYIRDLNASAIFKVPIKLGEKYIWSNVSSIQIPGCLTKQDEKPNVTNFIEKLKKDPTVDCKVSLCRVIRCNMHLRKDHKYTYNISGEVNSDWIEQTKLTSLQLDSGAVLDYDQDQFIYFGSSGNNLPSTKVGTLVEVYTEADFTKEITGGAVGGLVLLALLSAGLYKAGFFKSQYKQMLENSGQADGEADEGVGETAPAEPE